MQYASTFETARRLVARVERTVPWVALLAAVAGIAIVARANRDALASVEWSLSARDVVVASFAFAVAPLAQGVSFWLALRLLTGTTPFVDALVVWSRSYVVRYAPTGAVAIAYRVAARRRMQASAEQVLAAYGYEHVATIAAGAVACLVLHAAAGAIPPLPALAIAVAALALTATARPGGLGRLLAAGAGRLGVHVSPALPASKLLALVALNCAGWLGTAGGVYVVVAGVTGDAPGFVSLAATYTAGYLVGFVAPLAPGGVGVREGMLVLLLRGRYGFAVAAGISVAIRIVNVAGELVAVALVHALHGCALLRRRFRVHPVAWARSSWAA